MPKRRRNYFRIGLRTMRFNFTNDELATFVRLIALMSARWMEHSLTAEEAGRTTLNVQDVLQVTGRTRTASAQPLLHRVCKACEIAVSQRAGLTDIDWPNLAEYQGWDIVDARRLHGNREDPADPPAPSPSPSPNIEKHPTLREREQPPSAALAHPDVGALFAGGEGDQKAPDWVDIPLIIRSMSKLPGTEAEKLAWLDDELPLMGLEVLKDSKIKSTASRSAALCAIAFRYYRAHRSGTKPSKTTKATRPGYETATERAQREADEWLESKKEQRA